jgi:hypothetical protein
MADTASLLNVSRETVSRARKPLATRVCNGESNHDDVYGQHREQRPKKDGVTHNAASAFLCFLRVSVRPCVSSVWSG